MTHVDQNFFLEKGMDKTRFDHQLNPFRAPSLSFKNQVDPRIEECLSTISRRTFSSNSFQFPISSLLELDSLECSDPIKILKNPLDRAGNSNEHQNKPLRNSQKIPEKKRPARIKTLNGNTQQLGDNSEDESAQYKFGMTRPCRRNNHIIGQAGEELVFCGLQIVNYEFCTIGGNRTQICLNDEGNNQLSVYTVLLTISANPSGPWIYIQAKRKNGSGRGKLDEEFLVSSIAKRPAYLGGLHFRLDIRFNTILYTNRLYAPLSNTFESRFAEAFCTSQMPPYLTSVLQIPWDAGYHREAVPYPYSLRAHGVLPWSNNALKRPLILPTGAGKFLSSSSLIRHTLAALLLPSGPDHDR
ncbi:hypothetical protein EV360DRAFT_70768 [Lentinula raphanica]|nr:hypothetical protein EV360DRAFT_70768 [Lentinula raphanica]